MIGHPKLAGLTSGDASEPHRLVMSPSDHWPERVESGLENNSKLSCQPLDKLVHYLSVRMGIRV